MTELAQFQKDGVYGIYRFKGKCLLADEQGLGKTIQALEWIRRIPKRRPVFIITPASMKYTWQAEAALHFSMRIEVLEGFRKKRQMTLPGDIVIINYEILESWLPALLKAGPRCLIFDEIHYLKNATAKRTKAATNLAEGVDSVVGLSGTPLTNRPVELWPILNIIKPSLFPSFEKYAWRYCKPRYTQWGWVFDGAAHLDELHSILRRKCMIRRMKKSVLTELPDKIRQVVSFKLASYHEYNRAKSDFLGWLGSISPSRAKKAKKSQALTKIGYLLRLAAKLKLEWTTQWIKEFTLAHPNEKMVVLTMHTFVIEHLKERFPNSVVIDGRITGRKRVESVRKFQSNRTIQYLFGNVKAAGVGLTLTAARHGVFADFPWTPGDLMQGEDRVHRIGQKRQVFIHYLVALGTIEEKLIKILQQKASILDAVLNGQGGEIDFDIFDELLKEMKNEHKKIRDLSDAR